MNDILELVDSLLAHNPYDGEGHCVFCDIPRDHGRHDQHCAWGRLASAYRDYVAE